MRRVGLRFHLGVVILGTLLPVLAFSAWLIVNLHHKAREATQGELIEHAGLLSLAVDREVGTSISVLQALAASDHLRSGNLEGFDRFARSLLPTQPDWENVVLYTASGQQLINLRLPFGVPLPLAGDPETLEAVAQSRHPWVSNLFRTQVGQRYAINTYVPIVQDGELRYVLAATLSPSHMTALFQKHELADELVASLIDRNGIIVARNRRADEFVGQAATADFAVKSLETVVKDKGSLQTGTKGGTPVYAAFSRSPFTGWTITLRVATTTVDAPIRRSLVLLGGLAALVTGLGLMLAATVAHQIGRPIVALARAAPQIVSGDQTVTIPRSSVTEVDEVGRSMEAASRERQRISEQNRRLWEETEQRRRSAESLAEVSRLISRSLDPKGVAQAIVTSVSRLLDANVVALYRFERHSEDLVLLASLADGVQLPRRLSRGTAMVSLAMIERQPVMTLDVLNEPRIQLTDDARAAFEATGCRAVLAVPLLMHNESVGTLAVGALAGRVFSDDEVRLAQQFCDQAAIALEHARLYETAQRQLRHTETLLAVTQTVGSTVDLAEVFRRTIRAMVQAVGADLGGAWRLTPDSLGVIPFAGYKLPTAIRERVLAVAGSEARRLAEATQNLTDLVWSSDPGHDPRPCNHPWLEVMTPWQSMVMIPLRMNDATVGGFVVGWTHVSHHVTSEERDLLNGMAQAASVAAGNADLVDSATQHQARLEALLETSSALSRIQPLETLLTQIAKACAQLLDSPSVGIRLVEGDDLVLKATVGDADALMLTPRLKVGRDLASRVLDAGEPLMVLDPADDPRHIASHRAIDRLFGYGGWLGVPIRNGRPLGVLVIRACRQSGFSDEDQAIATAFAAQAATAIENARLYHEIQSAYGELESTKNQLTQSQKMEAIGRLAGGVAHDFNNLLTVIIGRLHLLRYGLKPDDPLAHEFEIIEHAAFRAATLTRQLLAFSRKQVLQLKRLDLNAAVNDVAPMLRRLIGEDIELTVTLGAIPQQIMGDQAQLEQVLMNLAINARDAMPSGGRLTLETAAAQLDATFLDDHGGAPASGSYVMLAVSDTGTGMTPEVQAQIFEPFFTTKEVDKGTGLGLSTVYGIVKQHQGHIRVESTVGLGSIFRIYFPSAAEPTEAAEPTALARSRVTRGSETILLVEDEPDVRLVARHILQASGYTVLEATDVDDALRIADQPGTVIDLLLTDVIMPGRNGRELAEHVQHAHPETRVLFMSGYTASTIAQHGVLAPDTAFLQKPFTPDSLAVKVRDVLDAHGAKSSRAQVAEHVSAPGVTRRTS